MKKFFKKLVFTLSLIISAISLGQANFEFISKPVEFHPDGTLATSSPITFILSNVPNEANNAINLRLYPYPDGIVVANALDNIGWTSGSDRVNMTLGLINDTDVNNGFYRTETVDNGDETFTKTYTIFNISNNGLEDTYKNGGVINGENYAPIVRLVHANGQERLNNSGEVGMGNGNNPLIVDQATLDQSPDYVVTHLVFSYYPPEENNTSGNGIYPHITANSSIDLFGSGDGSGKQNQILTFNSIGKKSTTASAFEVLATSTSGLADITYTVESGPATISDNIITLNGTIGIVTLKAVQTGNTDFNKAETFYQFEVIDLSTFSPEITTRLIEDYPIEMPSFYVYPIYITTAIEEADLITIDNIEVKVNGIDVPVTSENNLHYALWTPNSYGSHNVNITAYGSNGITTTILKTIEVTNIISNKNVQTLNEIVIEFNKENSRNYYGTYNLPQHIGSYNKITANMLVECPSETGDCDNWDRRAFIDVKGPDGNWIQIIRYITPFGVGCNHSIDLTDYASILQGEVEFRMFIDTWGTGGWQISLDFDFEEGAPQYLYSQVDELWDGFWDLGDPNNLQPIPVANYSYKNNVVSSHLRLSNTGHGWGSNNSQNAAEFYNATNYIDIDGIVNYTQNLWNDCNPNPDSCTGQLGTWSSNRAGWCPGTIAPPDIVDMTNQIVKRTVDFRYRLDPTYIDECHPNNPECVTGVTCDDCNDGFNPRYHIDGQLINFSNTPLIQGTLDVEEINNIAKYQLSAYPNPSSGKFQISSSDNIGKSVVNILSISGAALKTYYFNSSKELNNAKFDLSSLAKGLYIITIDNNAGEGALKIFLE